MLGSMHYAVFGGGCFWCTEAVFKMLRGVSSVTPGYAGGTTENPTYHEVCNANTGHAEVIQIAYNPEEITYNSLLTVFFGTHDATQINRQGNDIGPQYRSIILYSDEAHKLEAEKFIRELNDSSKEGKNIATEVVPLAGFYPAEKEHLDYYERNKNQAYCQLVIEPKLHKVQQRYAELIEQQSK